MSESRHSPQKVEAILYGLAAGVVIVFATLLLVHEIASGAFPSSRTQYAIVLILLSVFGTVVHLAFRRLQLLQAASWLILAALLIEMCTFVFLTLYAGAPPVPRTISTFTQFKFHPSLVGLPRPNFHGRVHDELVDVVVTHNGVGARGLKQFDPAKQSILVVGGSTTYDIGVNDDETWVELLSHSISDRFNVLNFGVPAQNSAQHIIFTALRASAYNPRCIIFYVGWNDIRNAHLTHLEPDFSSFALLEQYEDLGVINRYYSHFALGSLARIISYTVMDYPKSDRLGHVESTSDTRLEAIYRRNIKLLAVITKAIGARPVFIPQVLHYTKSNNFPDKPRWVPYIRHDAVMAIMRRFNDILREEAEGQGAAFIGAPLAYLWKDSEFIDQGHFSAEGSKAFSQLIVPDVARYCE